VSTNYDGPLDDDRRFHEGPPKSPYPVMIYKGEQRFG
jgi:hypothetical protein